MLPLLFLVVQPLRNLVCRLFRDHDRRRAVVFVGQELPAREADLLDPERRVRTEDNRLAAIGAVAMYIIWKERRGAADLDDIWLIRHWKLYEDGDLDHSDIAGRHDGRLEPILADD